MLRKVFFAIPVAVGLFLGCSSSDSGTSSAPQSGGTCGDGVRNGSEQCDGFDLGGATCGTATLGVRGGGQLKCNGLCAFDDTGCTAGMVGAGGGLGTGGSVGTGGSLNLGGSTASGGITGSGGTTGSGGITGSGGAAPACTAPQLHTGACGTCERTQCCKQLSDCFNDTTCRACWTGTYGSTCTNNSAFNALVGCDLGTCNSTCANIPQCTQSSDCTGGCEGTSPTCCPICQGGKCQMSCF